MSITFNWKSEYETGLPEVDSQHEGLFDLANRIQETGLENIRECVMELYQYTRRHFEAEEKFLEQIGYPEIQQHMALHESIIDKLNQLAEKDLETPEKALALKNFYFEWLTRHILTEDMKYNSYYQARNKNG